MNPTHNDLARSQDNGMNDAATAFPEAVVPQGPRNSIRSLRKQPAAAPDIENKPKSSQDFNRGIRKEEDEDRPAGWLNQEGALPAEGTAGETAIGKATSGGTTGSAHGAGQAAAGIAGGTGASGAATAGAKAAGDAQAAGVLSVGTKGAGSTATQAAAGPAGNAAGDSFASQFWSSTSGKVAAVAGGVLAVAVAAGGGSSDNSAQGSNPEASTKPGVNEGAQPDATQSAATGQPPSSPQDTGGQEIAPTYGPDNVSKAAVAHDASVKLASAVFAGTGEAPAFIRITGITPNESSPGAPALVMNKGAGDEKTLDVGVVISRADFDRISWDSAANKGGKFSFVALDSSQRPFDGVAEQSVEIRESRVAPDYPADRPAQNLIHDTGNALDATLFNGTDSNKAPDFIRITAVNPSNPANTDPALLLLADGAQQAKPLNVNDVIPAGEFDRISWNTANNDGGSFSFEALDADRQPILGSAPQTIVISEMPAHAPGYPATQPMQHVSHEQTLALPATVLAGSHSDRQPHAIRIESLDVQNPAEETLALHIDRDGSGPAEPESLKVGDTIAQADFGKLRWSSEGNTGGRFSFSALDAQGRKIDGVPEQMVHIHESPETPDYPGVSIAAVQFQSLHALSATVFTGEDDGKKPGFVRITAVSPQGTAPDANALFFDKDGPGGAAPTPIQDNQIISEAEFGKLLWDSQAAPFGSFTFEALDASKYPILQADGSRVTQTVSVFSHPKPPQYPADGQSKISMAHDTTLTIQPLHFTGADAEQASPAQIRILTIRPSGAQATGGLMIDRDGNDPEAPVAVEENQIIDRADFDKLRWNGAGNDGGKITFEAVAPDDNRILGSQEQTLTFDEHPAPPNYNTLPAAYGVQHDGTLTLPVERFSGNAGSTQATHIVIQGINARNAAPGSAALTLNGKPVELNTPIAAADFDKLQWNAGVNEGGTITFAPALADGTVILGSTPQTITIHEHPQAPLYRSTPNDVGIRFDGVDEIPLPIFRGEAQDRAPAHVKITAITPNGGAGTPLMLDADGAGNAAPQAVKIGDTIDLSKLAADARLTWDTTGNTGGTIRFVPVLDNGTQILGSTEQQLNIVEHGPAPTYPAATQTVSVANNGSALLSASLFSGTANPATFIRIGEMPTAAQGTPVSGTLVLNKGTAGEQILKTGDVIASDQFDNITWDASVMDGGYFTFTPVLDKAGTAFAGATTQRVEIRESGVAPDYSKTPVTTVAHNGSKLLPEANLIGADAARKPAAVRIDAINLNGGATDANALMLDKDGPNTGNPATPVTVGTVIAAADFGKLNWNAAGNTGGTVRFTALEDSPQPGQPYQPLLAQNGQAATGSFQVHESPLPPEYPQGTLSNPNFKIVVHDGKATYTDSAFGGNHQQPSADHSRAAFIRIEAIRENADTNTAESALRLNASNGKPLTLLKVGDVVEAADFTRINWDARGNNGGSFTFVPMDSARQVIEGAAPLTYQVHESPPAPTYDTSKQQVSVSYDQTRNLDRSLFAGTNNSTAPAGVRIERVIENTDTDPVNTGLQIMRGNTPVNLSAGPGNFTVIPASEFDSLRWNAAGNTGGSFKFQAVDASGHAIMGSPAQTITITEAAQVIPPTYPAGNQQTHTIAYADSNKSEYALDKTLFIGTTSSTTMTGILISRAPTEIDDKSPHMAPLNLLQDDGGSIGVSEGEFIPTDRLHQLAWNAEDNKGGTIWFQPVDANQQPIPGVAEQRIVLTEAPAPLPAYPADNQQTISTAYNQVHSLDARVFAGTDAQRGPDAIRITAISNPNTAGVDSGLRKYGGFEPVNVGDVLQKVSFSSLSWNGKGSTGGSFQFEALDRDGNVIGSKQTVNITEDGPVLAAVTAPQAQTVTHDGLTVLNASSFLTTDPAKSTPSNGTLQDRWFRITGVTETSDAAGSVGTRHYTWWNGKHHAYELIKVESGISKAEAESRAQAMGGKLWLVDANGEDVNVTSEYLRKHGANLGTVMHQSSTADSLNAFVVEFDDHQLPLKIMSPGDHNASWTAWLPYVVGNSTDPMDTNHVVDLDRIIWDSTRNTGGTITLEEVSGWSPWDPDDKSGGPRNRAEWLQQNPGQTPPDEIRKPGTQVITITITEAARGTVLTRSVDEADEADAGGNTATGNDAVANGASQASSMTAAADTAAASSPTGIVTRTAAGVAAVEGTAATEEATKERATDNATDAAASNALTPADLLGDQPGASTGSPASAAGNGPVDAGGRWFFSSPTLLEDPQQTPPTV